MYIVIYTYNYITFIYKFSMQLPKEALNQQASWTTLCVTSLAVSKAPCLDHLWLICNIYRKKTHLFNHFRNTKHWKIRKNLGGSTTTQNKLPMILQNKNPGLNKIAVQPFIGSGNSQSLLPASAVPIAVPQYLCSQSSSHKMFPFWKVERSVLTNKQVTPSRRESKMRMPRSRHLQGVGWVDSFIGLSPKGFAKNKDELWNIGFQQNAWDSSSNMCGRPWFSRFFETKTSCKNKNRVVENQSCGFVANPKRAPEGQTVWGMSVNRKHMSESSFLIWMAKKKPNKSWKMTF